jgi:hypothetical protein
MLTIEQRLERIEKALNIVRKIENIFGLFVFDESKYGDPETALESGELFNIDYNPQGTQTLQEINAVLHSVNKAFTFTGSHFTAIAVHGVHWFRDFEPEEHNLSIKFKDIFNQVDV